jgi:acetyl/propionyl-CoA carboxylase alpha subunit
VANVEAHITGTVWKIEVQVGDTVEEGDTVVILESMKMEMPARARRALPAAAGDRQGVLRRLRHRRAAE